MAVKSDKHENSEQIYYGDFSGGLNLSLPVEALAKNEMQLAENFEFDQSTGALKLRAGLVLMATMANPILNIAPVAGENAVLIRTNDNKIYRLTDYSISSALGTIDGTGDLSFVPWGDNNELVMCAGGKLYLYDGSTVSVVSESPAKCDFCFVRAGRVGIVNESDDSLYYSGVGDVHNWQFSTVGSDTWTDSDAVSLQVGYKDGCNIACVANLTDDVIVFKRPAGQPGMGRIYRVKSDYPNWSVADAARGSSAWNHKSAATTTNDLLFLTQEGVASLGTVSDYGDIKMKWAGAKVNPRIQKEIGNECRMWKMAAAGQVWVRAKASEMVWVYSYGIGGGAWTSFRFPGNVIDATCIGSNRYLAIGSQIFRMDDSYGTDNGSAFTGKVKMQGIRKLGQTLVKQSYISYNSSAASVATLNIEGNLINLPLGGQLSDVAATDTDIASTDTDALIEARSASMRNRMNVRVWDATAYILVTHGPFSLNAIGLEVAEV